MVLELVQQAGEPEGRMMGLAVVQLVQERCKRVLAVAAVVGRRCRLQTGRIIKLAAYLCL